MDPVSADPAVAELAVFRAVFAASPDGLLLVDDAGVIRLANPMAATLLGYAVDGLVGQPVEMLVPDSIRPAHAAFRQGYAQTPRTRPMGAQMDLVARRRDGSSLRVEIALSPLHAQGWPYVLASLRSVEDYPRVRQALQRARYSEHLAQLGRLAVDARDPQAVLQQVPALVAQALECAVARVALFDPDGAVLRIAAGTGLTGQAGQAGQALVGAVLAHGPGTWVGEVLALGQPVTVADAAQETRFDVGAANSASRVDAEAPALGAAWRSGLAVPLLDRGRSVGVLVVQDPQPQRFGEGERAFLEAVANLLATCLQRTRTEEALHHAQRLEAVGQLTGGIAHDFNNLLTVIQGNLQVLAELPSVSEDSVAPAMVAAATRASRRGAELTGKLLAFSRRQRLQPVAVDVAALLQSLADMLRRTMDQRIHIDVQVAAGCPDVLADPGQLESALLNVAINARDAMPEGGALRFLAQPAAWGALTPAERQAISSNEDMPSTSAPRRRRYVRLSVSDSGTGMSDAVLERAFEPFFTTKQAGRGTGLGLSTVYGFARQSGGTVSLTSRAGEGTTLALVLPQPDGAAAEEGERIVQGDVLPAGLHVLLVEDDAEVRAVARRFLIDLGCQVTACASGEEALRRLDEFQRHWEARGADLAHLPPVLLSDIALGAGMRGTVLAEALSQRWPDLSVLLTSGFSAELLGAEPAGALGWALLPKPYTREALAAALLRLLAPD